MFWHLLGTLCYLSFFIRQITATCTCGYYDEATGNLFTEYLITYFNETTTLPDDVFSKQSYEDGYERGWNVIYRDGANTSNVEIGASKPSSFYPANSSLILSLDPSTKYHLVMGGVVESLRKDILYGSFRSLMQPSQPWTGGSAMSMFLRYNQTQSIQTSTMNTNAPDTAWISTLIGEEFPDRSLGVNYSVILESNNTLYHGVSPWDYTEYRYDWTEHKIDFYIGDVLSRSVEKKAVGRATFPSTPSTLHLKHWSDGDPYSMEGPPTNITTGLVGWTRAFFNSSLMTDKEHKKFDSRCHVSDACRMDDYSLRGSSNYTVAALSQWKQSDHKGIAHKFAAWVLIFSVSITALLGCNIIYQRWPTKQSKTSEPEKTKFCRRLPPQLDGGVSSGYSEQNTLTSTAATLVNPTRQSSFVDLSKTRGDLNIQEVGSSSIDSASTHSEGKNPSQITSTSEKDIPAQTVAPIPAGHKPLNQIPRSRVDYLAGLISLATLLVTMIHFTYTFIPAAGILGAPHHYRSEVWFFKTVAPFLLNQACVGIFFITSTRFLIEKYLKTGNLRHIAEKAAGRSFRIIIPIAAIAMLEYFLIDCGAITWLQYLPSVSWSTWPYVVEFTNFASYLSEVIEVLYLIPPAAPQLTYNYCTGVLWTIPVQLQFSWVTLLGVVVVYEIKTPYKRGLYYAFCIINSWYAQSWGSFFWFGILLTDLDVTYAYKPAIQKRKIILYPILWIAAACTLLGLGNDLVAAWTTFTLPTVERGIHPDILTGLPIAQTSRKGYPDYFYPRLNGLVFAVGLQVLVELSSFMQMVFSIKPLLMIFPHIFSIYLIHGFVFWSLGSVIAVHLNADGWPYWANILVVGVSCYLTLFLGLPFLTPIVETLGKNVTFNLWTWMHDSPAKRKMTLFPYGKELLVSEDTDNLDKSLDEEMGSSKGEEEKGKEFKTTTATSEVP